MYHSFIVETVVAYVQLHRSFAEGRPPDPLPCQSCLNSHDKSFVGGWVADVVLGNPVGDVLMGFMDREVKTVVLVVGFLAIAELDLFARHDLKVVLALGVNCRRRCRKFHLLRHFVFLALGNPVWCLLVGFVDQEVHTAVVSNPGLACTYDNLEKIFV